MYKALRVGNDKLYSVIHPDLECKEGWIFMANYLGFGSSKKVAMDFVTDLSNKYPSVEIYRTFYTDETTHRYAETSGLVPKFGKKSEADNFALRLNKGIEDS